jgi:predicted metal-dependent HD superfamily phosphohydrolase
VETVWKGAVCLRYRAAVREEYAALDEPAWRTGCATVMAALLARDPLYGTDVARRRWEAMAKANIARELDSLMGPPR